MLQKPERPALAGAMALRGQSRCKKPKPPRAVVGRLRGTGDGMKHAIKHIHFVGIGGSGMCGIAEVLHNLGYRISGSDLADSATLQRLGGLGIQTFVGHDGGNIDRRRRGRHLHRGAGRQPRGAGRAREAHSGRAARADAGRADAPEAGHRHRRHARQDHHHQPGRQRAGRGRAGPDLRDRRPAQQRRRQRQAGQRATTSWSRPTSPTPPS